MTAAPSKRIRRPNSAIQVDDPFRRLVAIDEMVYLIRTRLAAAMLLGKVDLTEDIDLDGVISELLDLAASASLDLVVFRNRLLQYVAWNTRRIAASISQPVEKRVRRRRSQPAVMKFLESAKSAVEAELKLIPAGADKAIRCLNALVNRRTIAHTDQIYDAMVYLGDSARSLSSLVVTQWREEQEIHRESGRAELNENLFWVSLDFRELFDALSRYRLVEAFEIGGFDPAMNEIEGTVAAPILERCSDAFEPGQKDWRSSDAFGVAFDLWMLSRSNRLTARLQPVTNIAVEWLTNMQHPLGYWLRPIEPIPASGSRFQPSTSSTALATAALLKVAVTDRGIAAAQRGASWLADHQGKKGTWSGTEKDVLFPTTIALEALLRSGRTEYRPLVELGLAGLLDLQQAIGTWEDGRLPFPLQTVLVLDVFRIRHYLDIKIEQFAAAAVGFLRSAAGLRFIPGPINRQMAVIAAAQGSEYLLYALLEAIGADPFRAGSGTETKGLKVALSEFEEHLRSVGTLAAGKMATHASALRQLSNLRDQVVHKALDVSIDQVALVDKAIRFASLYSQEIWGRDTLA